MRKPTKEKPSQMRQIADLIAEQSAELVEAHLAEALVLLDETEKKVINIALGVEIDSSEPTVTVKTKISFAKKVTDSRASDIDDPAQPRLIETDKSELATHT